MNQPLGLLGGERSEDGTIARPPGTTTLLCVSPLTAPREKRGSLPGRWRCCPVPWEGQDGSLRRSWADSSDLGRPWTREPPARHRCSYLAGPASRRTGVAGFCLDGGRGMFPSAAENASRAFTRVWMETRIFVSYDAGVSFAVVVASPSRKHVTCRQIRFCTHSSFVRKEPPDVRIICRQVKTQFLQRSGAGGLERGRSPRVSRIAVQAAAVCVLGLRAQHLGKGRPVGVHCSPEETYLEGEFAHMFFGANQTLFLASGNRWLWLGAAGVLSARSPCVSACSASTAGFLSGCLTGPPGGDWTRPGELGGLPAALQVS